MSQAYGPLQGVKVVSCSTAQAGTVPYMLMADLGADVIKIEVPEGGDPGVRKRASRPITRPIRRMPIRVMSCSPSNLKCGQHRHMVRGELPVAQVDVDMVALDGAGKGRRSQDMVEPPAAVGLAPVVVAVAPP